MITNRTRLMALSGATLALVVASSAAVTAHPDGDGRRGFGRDRVRAERGADGVRGILRDRVGVGALRGAFDDLERRETTLQMADGTSSRRVEQGTLESVTDTAIQFTVGGDEDVTVVVDEDTRAFELTTETIERRGSSRQRLVPTEVEIGELEAGAEIAVWSSSEDDGEFVASRVVVRPTDTDTDDGTASESEDSTTADADEEVSAPPADA